jgi:hypothetical protein
MCPEKVEARKLAGELAGEPWELLVGFYGEHEHCAAFKAPGTATYEELSGDSLNASQVLGGNDTANSRWRYVYGYSKRSVDELRIVLSSGRVEEVQVKNELFFYTLPTRTTVEALFGVTDRSTVVWCQSPEDEVKDSPLTERIFCISDDAPLLPTPPPLSSQTPTG